MKGRRKGRRKEDRREGRKETGKKERNQRADERPRAMLVDLDGEQKSRWVSPGVLPVQTLVAAIGFRVERLHQQILEELSGPDS
jgi:hypothetical protein